MAHLVRASSDGSKSYAASRLHWRRSPWRVRHRASPPRITFVRAHSDRPCRATSMASYCRAVSMASYRQAARGWACGGVSRRWWAGASPHQRDEEATERLARRRGVPPSASAGGGGACDIPTPFGECACRLLCGAFVIVAPARWPVECAWTPVDARVSSPLPLVHPALCTYVARRRAASGLPRPLLSVLSRRVTCAHSALAQCPRAPAGSIGFDGRGVK